MTDPLGTLMPSPTRKETMSTKYIVLAHLPLDHKDPIFAGEFALHPTEWIIFDGVHGKAQAEGKAKTFRKYFHEVQIREVSAEL
jgi:hypothetical protein